MSQLIIVENIYEPLENEVIEFDGPVTVALQARFNKFPDGGKLFYDAIAEENQLFVERLEQIELLDKMQGKFFLVVAPGAPIYIVYAIIAVVVAILLTVLLKPKIPNTAQRNTQSTSPNNDLAQRSNQPRTGARIPDIFGQVRSTLDMIAVPYTVYVNNLQNEVSFLCVGRGSYMVYDAKDDTTPISQITGSFLEVYDPGSLTYDATGSNPTKPQFTVNGKIPTDFPLYFPQKSTAVNGQTLRPAGEHSARGAMYGMSNGTLNFYFDGDPGDFDLTKIFNVGDTVDLTGSTVPNSSTSPQSLVPVAGGFIMGITSPTINVGDQIQIIQGTFTAMRLVSGSEVPDRIIDLSGIYTVSSIAATTNPNFPSGAYNVQLTSPQSVSYDWSYVPAASSVQPAVKSAVITHGATGSGTNLSGRYSIIGVQKTYLAFTNPGAVNPAWNTLSSNAATAQSSRFTGAVVLVGESLLIGPYIVAMEGGNKLLCNFVAVNGMYKDDGTNQSGASVDIEVGYTPVDATGVSTGPTQTAQISVDGNAVDRETKASSLFIDLPTTGRYAVTARRLTPTDNTFKGSVVDEVKWADLYHMRVPTTKELTYNDVTTVRMVQAATMGALSVKDRKLNMLVTRKLPLWNLTDNTFSQTLAATTQIADIFAFCVTDPWIGGLPASVLDYAQIGTTLTSVQDYFNIASGKTVATQFSYTFDKDNTTTEETLQMIANAGFCTAYRSVDKIRFSFLKKDNNATLLFNHRNKVPGSETRVVQFGTENGQQGVEYTWVDPTDDSIASLYYPPGAPSYNLKKVESAGIRNLQQATLHAAREWANMKYRYMQVEFDALSQAEMLMLNDVILVSDDTNYKTIDGEVYAVNGNFITLSQPLPAEIVDGSSVNVFLQLPDKTVQTTVGGVADRVTVNLTDAPKLPLVVDLDEHQRTVYRITPWQAIPSSEPVLFLVTEVTPGESNTVKVKGTVYNDALFEGDLAFHV